MQIWNKEPYKIYLYLKRHRKGIGESMKKVSIIVPIYNVKQYVRRCIESLINQTYENVEIILVNDGSDDGSSDIIKEYGSNYKVIILNKENGGLSSARNAGMDYMTGDYILFVDGDDYLDRETVFRLMEYCQDETQLVLFPYIREYYDISYKTFLFEESYLEFDEKEVHKKIFARLIGPDDTSKKNGPDSMDRLNTAWGKLYKRDLVEAIRFTDTMVIGPEDCWFNIQALRKCKSAKYVTDIFYHYEKSNQTSLLHKYNENFLEKRWRMYHLIRNFMNETELDCYKRNLKNRILCEQFGILQNIWISDLNRKEKRKLTKEVLYDRRYQMIFKRTSLSFLDDKWKPFYLLCRRKYSFGIEWVFRLWAINRTRSIKYE